MKIIRYIKDAFNRALATGDSLRQALRENSEAIHTRNELLEAIAENTKYLAASKRRQLEHEGRHRRG